MFEGIDEPAHRHLPTSRRKLVRRLTRHFPKSRRARMVSFGIGCVAVVAVILDVALIIREHDQRTVGDGLPASILQQVQGFAVYYPKGAADAALETGSASYRTGVLVFGMTDSPGKTLAVTEEAIPRGFDTSTLKADKQYDGRYGQIFISDLFNRTSAAIFTNDHTWVLINSPTPIGADAMETIANAFTPVK